LKIKKGQKKKKILERSKLILNLNFITQGEGGKTTKNTKKKKTKGTPPPPPKKKKTPTTTPQGVAKIVAFQHGNSRQLGTAW
jgi:hypothetical protein